VYRSLVPPIKNGVKAHKKLTVLSFGDEAAEEEEHIEKINEIIKTKSAHDVAEVRF